MMEKFQAETMRERFHDLAAGSWVLVLLLVAGFVAVVTAILVAWPAIAYLASRFFGGGG